MGSRARLPVFINLGLLPPTCALLGGKCLSVFIFKMGKFYCPLYKVAERLQRINRCDALRVSPGTDEAPS